MLGTWDVGDNFRTVAEARILTVSAPLPPCARPSASPAGARCVSSARSTTDGTSPTARVVARGDVASVLALPGFAKAGEMLLHNHPSGNLEPSDADLRGRGADARHRRRLRDHRQRRVASCTSWSRCRSRAVIVPLDLDAIDARSRPGRRGARRTTARYERPPEPARRRRAVARLYNRGGVGLLEAGTGVGKSLGYLLPALRWAAANKRAHGRVHQHDQPAGAARRQGPAVPGRRARATSRCASRCSRAGATTSACSGSSKRAGAHATLFAGRRRGATGRVDRSGRRRRRTAR